MLNQEKLIKKHPSLFRLAKDEKYPIYYGIECGTGWFNLISRLLDELSKNDPEKSISIQQIKSKFGGLRCYIKFGTEINNIYFNKIYNIINKYEKESLNTCEICGIVGTKRIINSYIYILCDTCKI